MPRMPVFKDTLGQCPRVTCYKDLLGSFVGPQARTFVGPSYIPHNKGRNKEKALQQKSLQSLIFTQSGRRDLTRPARQRRWLAQPVKRSEAAERPKLNPRPPEPPCARFVG
jgi:hypothetical protein